MAPAMIIDPADGAIRLGEAVLASGDAKVESEARLGPLLSGRRDMGNGYEWLNVGGLAFGDMPCHLALCFLDGRLCEAAWSVDLPGAPLEDGWPTREAIDAEVDFVRAELARQLGGTGVGVFPWGEVWSAFDGKGFLAANGLRYGARR